MILNENHSVTEVIHHSYENKTEKKYILLKTAIEPNRMNGQIQTLTRCHIEKISDHLQRLITYRDHTIQSKL